MKALLHSVYDQPDADAVHAQFDRILDALADKLPAVADASRCRPGRHLGVHQRSPKRIWRQIWSNNPVRHEALRYRMEVRGPRSPVPCRSRTKLRAA